MRVCQLKCGLTPVELQWLANQAIGGSVACCVSSTSCQQEDMKIQTTFVEETTVYREKGSELASLPHPGILLAFNYILVYKSV